MGICSGCGRLVGCLVCKPTYAVPSYEFNKKTWMLYNDLECTQYIREIFKEEDIPPCTIVLFSLPA